MTRRLVASGVRYHYPLEKETTRFSITTFQWLMELTQAQSTGHENLQVQTVLDRTIPAFEQRSGSLRRSHLF